MSKTTGEFVQTLRDGADATEKQIGRYSEVEPGEHVVTEEWLSLSVEAFRDAANLIEEQAAALKPMVGVSDSAQIPQPLEGCTWQTIADCIDGAICELTRGLQEPWSPTGHAIQWFRELQARVDALVPGPVEAQAESRELTCPDCLALMVKTWWECADGSGWQSGWLCDCSEKRHDLKEEFVESGSTLP